MQRQPDGASRRRAERPAAVGSRGPSLQLQPERALGGRGGGRLPARPHGQRLLRLHPAGPGGRDLVPAPHRAVRRRGGCQHLRADRYGRRARQVLGEGRRASPSRPRASAGRERRAMHLQRL